MEDEYYMRTRIAPTPSGYLHLGNAFNFLLTWLWARQEGGLLLLRIDDMDQTRVRPEYIEDIFRSLEWLGIDYDQGPAGPDALQKYWSQVHRMDLYQDTLETLQNEQAVFACSCSRKDIQALTVDGAYPGTCRGQRVSFEQEKVAWRFRTPKEAAISWKDIWIGEKLHPLSSDLIDAVVRRKDGLPAYQLCSVVDDLFFDINAISRGQDLLDSTVFQHLLAQSLREPTWAEIRWLHHPLILDGAGNKLSKSAGSTSLKAMRETGRKPLEVYQQVSTWLPGEHPVAQTLADLQAQFVSFHGKFHPG